MCLLFTLLPASVSFPFAGIPDTCSLKEGRSNWLMVAVCEWVPGSKAETLWKEDVEELKLLSSDEAERGNSAREEGARDET